VARLRLSFRIEAHGEEPLILAEVVKNGRQAD
jgi:hypothetical protein